MSIQVHYNQTDKDIANIQQEQHMTPSEEVKILNTKDQFRPNEKMANFFASNDMDYIIAKLVIEAKRCKDIKEIQLLIKFIHKLEDNKGLRRYTLDALYYSVECQLNTPDTYLFIEDENDVHNTEGLTLASILGEHYLVEMLYTKYIELSRGVLFYKNFEKIFNEDFDDTKTKIINIADKFFRLINIMNSRGYINEGYSELQKLEKNLEVICQTSSFPIHVDCDFSLQNSYKTGSINITYGDLGKNLLNFYYENNSKGNFSLYEFGILCENIHPKHNIFFSEIASKYIK